MKKLSYYIMLLGIVFFTSCEDFLDQVPKHNLTLDNAVTDYSGAKNILNGMYAIVASGSEFGGYLVSVVFTGWILLVLHDSFQYVL
jgi:uncharacterized membrane protein